jgi:hypothetical protein
MQKEHTEKDEVPEEVEHPRIMHDREAPGRTKNWELWYGVLGGPVIWAAHFTITYAVASTSCQLGFLYDQTILGINALTFVLIVVTVVAIAAMVYGIFLSYRNWQLLRDDEREGIGQPEQQRHRFMAFSGIAMTALFLASVVLSLVPSFFFHPCQ